MNHVADISSPTSETAAANTDQVAVAGEARPKRTEARRRELAQLKWLSTLVLNGKLRHPGGWAVQSHDDAPSQPNALCQTGAGEFLSIARARERAR